MANPERFDLFDAMVRDLIENMEARHQCWRLDGHNVVPLDDVKQFADWMAAAGDQRIVKQEYVGKYLVSTVFLGFNHNFYEVGPPILFETMVFSERWDGKTLRSHGQERCSTWEQAEQMHREMVKKAKKEEFDDA